MPSALNRDGVRPPQSVRLDERSAERGETEPTEHRARRRPGPRRARRRTSPAKGQRRPGKAYRELIEPGKPPLLRGRAGWGHFDELRTEAPYTLHRVFHV